MFDMGFLELMVVLIVGLLVIGPEKLPGTIKTCVIWINSIRRNLAAARDEFEKQIGADEIRREIHNHQVLESLRKAQSKQEEMLEQINSGNYTGVNHSTSTSENPDTGENHNTSTKHDDHNSINPNPPESSHANTAPDSESAGSATDGSEQEKNSSKTHD